MVDSLWISISLSIVKPGSFVALPVISFRKGSVRFKEIKTPLVLVAQWFSNAIILGLCKQHC
jgi:hypothetical protein